MARYQGRGENRKKKIKINPAHDETAQTLVSIPVAATVPGGFNLGINPVLTSTGFSSLLEITRDDVLALKSVLIPILMSKMLPVINFHLFTLRLSESLKIWL
jgi:hypothetical protein